MDGSPPRFGILVQAWGYRLSSQLPIERHPRAPPKAFLLHTHPHAVARVPIGHDVSHPGSKSSPVNPT